MQHFPSGELCRCSSAVCWPSQHISGFCVSGPGWSSIPVGVFWGLSVVIARTSQGFDRLIPSFPVSRRRTPREQFVSVRSVERYLVDGMNVIGARPDAWWRDLDGAVVRLARCLAGWQAALRADVAVVFDGRPPPGLDELDLGGLELAFAGEGRSADDEIVRRVGIDPAPRTVRVVTSDRALRERVRVAGAGEVVGAGRFRRLLDDYC